MAVRMAGIAMNDVLSASCLVILVVQQSSDCLSF